MHLTQALKLKEIHSLIEHRQLKQAIDGVKELASRAQQWSITDKISEVETNYQYMIHYLIEGKRDPEQQHIYEKLLRDLYTIADDAAGYLLLSGKQLLSFLISRDCFRCAYRYPWRNSGASSPGRQTLSPSSICLKRVKRRSIV